MVATNAICLWRSHASRLPCAYVYAERRKHQVLNLTSLMKTKHMSYIHAPKAAPIPQGINNAIDYKFSNQVLIGRREKNSPTHQLYQR